MHNLTFADHVPSRRRLPPPASGLLELGGKTSSNFCHRHRFYSVRETSSAKTPSDMCASRLHKKDEKSSVYMVFYINVNLIKLKKPSFWRGGDRRQAARGCIMSWNKSDSLLSQRRGRWKFFPRFFSFFHWKEDEFSDDFVEDDDGGGVWLPDEIDFPSIRNFHPKTVGSGFGRIRVVGEKRFLKGS